MKLLVKVVVSFFLVSLICDSQEIKDLDLLKRKFEAEASSRHVSAKMIAEAGESGVKWLLQHPRSMDGVLEEAIGVGLVYAELDVFPFLEKLLNSGDSGRTVFAIQVSSQLMDERYIPLYKKLLHKRIDIEGSGPEITISDYAQGALEMFQWKREHPNCYKIHREALLEKAQQANK